MSKLLKIILSIVGLVCIFILVSTFFNDHENDQSAHDDGVVKIGYIGPLTGDTASYIDILHGMQLKVQEWNKLGGIDGEEIEIIVEDGRCEGGAAASAAQKLVHIDKVDAIVGGQCSAETLAAAPIANAAGVTMISAASSHPDVSNAGDYIFRVQPSDVLLGAAFNAYFQDSDSVRVALISENTEYAVGLRNAVLRQAPDTIDEFVFDETVDAGQKDIRTLLTRLQKVDFDVLFLNPQSDAVLISWVQQFRQLGFEQPMLGQQIADSQTLGQQAADEVEGMPLLTVPSFGEGGDLEERFIEQFGTPQQSISWAAFGYDATSVLLEALKRADAPEEIKEALYDAEHTGVIGTISFDENGDVVGIPFIVKEFRDGKLEVIKELQLE